MKLFSKKKPKPEPQRKHNEWFLSGDVKRIVKKDNGAQVDITHMIQVKGGDKMMHHRVWLNLSLWDEVADKLDLGMEVCVTGQVRYGRNGLPCYNRATAIDIL